MRLVQLVHSGGDRRIAVVDQDQLCLLDHHSVYDFVQSDRSTTSREALDYDPIWRGESDWRLLPAIDHPEPARCVVSGTGLTHLQGAANRDAMHQNTAAVTDSARMYQLGVAEGKPAAGQTGAAPEW